MITQVIVLRLIPETVPSFIQKLLGFIKPKTMLTRCQFVVPKPTLLLPLFIIVYRQERRERDGDRKMVAPEASLLREAAVGT